MAESIQQHATVVSQIAVANSPAVANPCICNVWLQRQANTTLNCGLSHQFPTANKCCILGDIPIFDWQGLFLHIHCSRHQATHGMCFWRKQWLILVPVGKMHFDICMNKQGPTTEPISRRMAGTLVSPEYWTNRMHSHDVTDSKKKL